MTAQAIMSGSATTVQTGNRTSGLLSSYGAKKEKASESFLDTVKLAENRADNQVKGQTVQRNNNTVLHGRKPGTGKRTPAKELNPFGPSENNEPVAENGKMPENMPEETVTDEAVEILYTAVANIVNYLTEELSVTNEELTESLSELSLSFEDLTKPEGIVQFIVGTEFEGDPALALNDPDFPEAIKEILEFTGEQMKNLEENNVSAEEVFRVISENGFTTEETPEAETADVTAETELLAETGKPVMQTEEKTAIKDNSGEEETDNSDDDNITLKNAGNVQKREAVNESKEDSSENGSTFEKDLSSSSAKETSKSEASGHGKITMGQFIENLVQAAQTKENTASEAGQVNFRDIAFQIIEQVKVTNFTGETRLSMMLSPESLGRVELMISTKEGVMTASLTTETQVAKEAIESQMAILKENLETQGIKVETIEVNVSDFHFEDGDRAKENGDRKKGGKKNFISFDEEDGIMTEPNRTDALLEQVFLENGSTVTYRA